MSAHGQKKTARPGSTGRGGVRLSHQSVQYREAERQRKLRVLDEIKRKEGKKSLQRNRPGCLMSGLRLSELERLYLFRWGATLPNDDAGVDDLMVALHHIANGHRHPLDRMILWCKTWAPWMPEARARALCQSIAQAPKKFGAETLAKRMRLEFFEREMLKIRTIGAHEIPKPVRERYQRFQKNRKRSKQTRAEYEANSLSRTKPWEAEGIHRRTWERRRAKARAASAD